MSLNLSTLRTRSLTAIFFVAIMLGGLLYNYWSFFILFSIIHFGCWLEYQKLVGLIDSGYNLKSNFHKYMVMLGGWGFMLFMTHEKLNFIKIDLQDIGKWMMILIAVLILIVEIIFKKTNRYKNIAHSFFGLLYISLSFGLMMSLRNHGLIFKGSTLMIDFGFALPLLLIVSIWINDTMAYIVGSLIGKNPLSSISPKKTWEGTIGGVILCIIIMSSIVYFLFDKSLLNITLLVSGFAAVFGTLGDLLESKLKRLANVKDSGSFMPGHGGFLDRFDSLLIATPIVWLTIEIYIKYFS